MKRNIFITEHDKVRLERLLEAGEAAGGRDRKDVQAMATELARAQVVEPKDIPGNVVTMNSKVLLRDVDTNEEMTYVLAFPHDADAANGYISVLAPIGTALLGYAEGDVIEWPVPVGVCHIKIEKILYQPEAAGDFNA